LVGLGNPKDKALTRNSDAGGINKLTEVVLRWSYALFENFAS